MDSIETMLPGGRYPTPRHVAAHMARLVRPTTEAQVADLTCGSGSLLAAVKEICDNAHLTGFEISGNWARLAWTNAVLHGADVARLAILPRNSLQGVNAANERDCYDVVVMNPPFGNREDPVLVRQAFGDDSSGTSSEVIFPNLAIQRLKDEGTAMVLAPAGVLFRRSTAERELRRRLLEECTLRAVVAYPEDAFQPYSGLETHGLLFHKQASQADHATWLFAVSQDGRTGVKDRQDDPQAPNQLPLAEAVLLQQGELVASVPDASGTALVHVCWFPTEKPEEVARPGCPVPGYWIKGQTAAIVMRRYAMCANGATRARAHWVTWEWENSGGRWTEYLVLQQTEDDRLCRAWQPVTDSTAQTAIHWDIVDVVDISENYWTLKLDDKGEEKDSWLRLYVPNGGGEWRLTDNKDTPQPIMPLRQGDEAATNIVLVVDRQGRPVASLTIEDARKLDNKGALTIKASDGSTAGHLWPLDLRTGTEEESEREHRGYVLLLGRPVPDFHRYSSRELPAFVAELGGSDTEQTGLLIGELAADGSVAHLDVWLGTDPDWRTPDQRAVNGLCFDADGLVFGLALSRTALQTSDSTDVRPNYDLQPSTYLPHVVTTRPVASPAYILGQIKRNQHQLIKYIDFLLGIIEGPPTTNQEMPSPLTEVSIPQEWLSPDQVAVWQSILAYSQEVDAETNSTKTIFRLEDLKFSESCPSADQIQQSLQLFAAMGMIVPVIVKDGLYYRRVTELDVAS